VSRRRLLAALAGVAALGAAAAVADALRARPAALAQARFGRADPGADGVQRVELVVAGGEYRPNVVRARAGAPLRLRVEVRGRDGCATRLLVPDLGVDLALVEGGVAEATVPAARPGSYVFTCAERMVKGVLVLE
jgi:plastocyanin domain-containing protein